MSWQEDLQQLDRALAAGQISADDYRLRRDEVLATAAQALPGGAPQQQQPPQPPPGPFPPPFRWGQAEPSEATQVVQPGDAEKTQVVRPGGTPAQPAQPQSANPDSEKTQFVRPVQSNDSERTQVVPTGTPSGGFPAQIFPQQPPAPAWQDASAPPWGSSDGSDGNVWSNVQGPEVFSDSDSGGGKGKIIAIVVVVLLLVGGGVGAYFIWGPGKGENTAAPTSSSSAPPTSSTPPSPPPVRKTPDGPFVEVQGKTNQFKTLDIADALVAKVPTFEEAQLLQQSGVTDVRFAVGQDDAVKLSQGIWAFKTNNPAATLTAVENLYQSAQFELLPTSAKNVPVRHLGLSAFNTTATYRAHYISKEFVVRVEAYGADEAAVKTAFDALLKRQLDKFPATS
ncbi:hypothetical protein [Umezawaea sp. Da 62-37]|uniref:hypothetical protein n=1 Tax=Umezawaea sp. Da 62-37 TaxID=3075927 RepID=UPI0028F70FA7|nr:hypothetical protein [Umezawaea sp. Da 62-37]WNV91482.1 hypothetical protein RM788_25460 [Umezawaea sp. Da 62-37]